MLPEAIAALACPHDGTALELRGRTLGCEHGHRFDLARQGYATLIARPLAHHGDAAVMVERRQRVHAARVLGAIHDAVADAAGAPSPYDRPPATSGADGLVCDVGAGPGTYLAAVLDRLPERTGLAIDVSKAAARRAARCHPRASAIVADVWGGLPLRTGSVALLLDVFAPRNASEFARVVVEGGRLVVVTPDADHLAELRSAVGMLDVPSGKAEQVAHELERGFRLVTTTQVRERVRVPGELAVDLARMGPSGHHLDPAAPSAPATGPGPRAGAEGAITVTLAATVSRFERTDPA